MIGAAVAFRWISVAGQDDVDSHFRGTLATASKSSTSNHSNTPFPYGLSSRLPIAP